MLTLKKRLTIIGVGVGAILLAALGAASFEKIKPGYVGVIYAPNGGVKDMHLRQGWHFINPLYKVTEYTIAIEQDFLSKDHREGSRDDDSFNTPTADGKSVNVDAEYSYSFDPDRVTELFIRFRGATGKEIQNSFMRGKLKTWVGEVTSKFTVLDIHGSSRTKINAEIYRYVKDKFEPYGIIIESINLTRITPDKDTEKAIQARVNAQQELERVKIEKDQAVIKAEKLAIEEEGKKAVKIIQANAEAEAITLRAEAQAEANIKIAESITPELVRYETILKWNGELPQVTGETVPMLNLK